MGFGFDSGFGTMGDVMFSIAPVVGIVIMAVVIGMVVYGLVNGTKQWHKNNQSPILDVRAKVVAKRADVSVHHHHDANNIAMDHTTTSTTYYATFEVESGDRMELRMPAAEYGLLAEGDSGTLRFQGTRYLGFTRG